MQKHSGSGSGKTGQLASADSHSVVLSNEQFAEFKKSHATATHTRPTVTTTSSTILAANANRKSAQIFNQSGAVVFIKLGVAAVANEGFRLVNNEYYPVPEGYTGDVRAIRAAGSGAIDVMEGTA